METSVYRVDTRMIPPVILAMGFALFLLVLEGTTNRGFLLLFVLLPFFYLGLEILARKITVDSRGILVSKFLRSVFVEWPQVESLDAVQSGGKLFIIIQTDQSRPVLITNTISPFGELAERILQSVPPAKISPAGRELLLASRAKQGPLMHAWIICLIMAGMVAGKILGYA
jgi:hypothetical protein